MWAMADSGDLWAQCELCSKWRRLPDGALPPSEDSPWICSMNTNSEQNTCAAAEDVEEEDDQGQHSSTGGQHFDLGPPHGTVEASTRHPMIGLQFMVPNNRWAGFSSGSTLCRLCGKVERFKWPGGECGPVFILQELDDHYYYPFALDSLPLKVQAQLVPTRSGKDRPRAAPATNARSVPQSKSRTKSSSSKRPHATSGSKNVAKRRAYASLASRAPPDEELDGEIEVDVEIDGTGTSEIDMLPAEVSRRFAEAAGDCMAGSSDSPDRDGAGCDRGAGSSRAAGDSSSPGGAGSGCSCSDGPDACSRSRDHRGAPAGVGNVSSASDDEVIELDDTELYDEIEPPCSFLISDQAHPPQATLGASLEEEAEPFDGVLQIGDQRYRYKYA